MKSLINCRKYSNSMARLIATVLLKDNGVDCYMEKASDALNMRASRSAILEAFKKDISKTANDLFNAQNIINSIRNGKVVEFDSIHNTIEDVFLTTYNAENSTITLSGVVFDAAGVDKNTMSKQEIEAQVLKNLFDIERKELNGVLKSLRKYEETLSDIDKAILYPSTILADKIIKKISDEDIAFGKYRARMSYEDQLEYDIKFKRTGIDGVIQNATYIDVNGIKQLAASHKQKDSVELERLLKSGLKYIDAIEVDGDGDLRKVNHLLRQIEKLTLNTKVKFTFKGRKLGNYKAGGLCIASKRIVAEDIRDSTAILHEIAHHIHLITLSENKFVNYMIDKLTPLIELDDEITMSKEIYYKTPTEVVARACEIAALFAKEEGRLAIDDDEDFEIIKSREYYTLNKGIYFNFTDFDDETKQEMSTLFKLFYETNPDQYIESDFDNFVKIDTQYRRTEKKLSFIDLINQERKKQQKELKALYSLVTSQNIEIIFANRKNAPLMELAKKILANIRYLGGHKLRMSAPDWRKAIEDKSGVINFIFDVIQKNSSKKEWIKFLVEFKKHSWNSIKKEILLTGFSMSFAISLQKELEEHETPNHDKFKEYIGNLLNGKIGSLLDQDLYADKVYIQELVELNSKILVEFDANQMDIRFLSSLTKKAISKNVLFEGSLLNKSLKEYESFMRWAVERYSNAITYIPNSSLVDKKVFMLFVCRLNGFSNLVYMGKKLYDDVDFAKTAIAEESTCLSLFSERVQAELEKPKVKAVAKTTRKKPKNDDFIALLENGEIVEFERTDGKGVEKVLKIKDKISDFKSFNQYMKSKKIGYYSRIAKGFILYKEYVEKVFSNTKNVAAAATVLYSADMLQNFANGTLF